MLIRSPDLADQMSGIQQPAIFTLRIDAARLKAREVLNQLPAGWLCAGRRKPAAASDGQIEFTMRHLPTAD